MDANLGPAALFSNSTVDIDTICLNEELLKEPSSEGGADYLKTAEMTRSTPDIQSQLSDDVKNVETPKRVNSEPLLPMLVDDEIDGLSTSGTDEE